MTSGEVQIDILTHRPRTPNPPYTKLTDVQINNLHKSSSPFFHHVVEPPPLYAPREGGRHYLDRYSQSVNSNSVRAGGHGDSYSWLGDKYDRFPPLEHDTCRSRASVRWGPNKAGERTRSHFFGESIDRYTTIDLYRRPATNYPGPVTIDYGRPADGYYAQRFPSKSTWFLSSAPLNHTQVLQSVYPKTKDQHTEVQEAERLARMARAGKWPEYSEYTAGFLVDKNTKPVHLKTTRELMKEYAMQAYQQ